MYRMVDQSIIRRLAEIAGPKAVFSDEDTLNIYSKDETIGLSYRPEVVVKPTTSKEILEVMRLSTLENIPITPRGKGTGLSGGAIPVYGGIVLSCERMEKIVDIDHDNLMLVTEPGIITGELQKAVEDISKIDSEMSNYAIAVFDKAKTKLASTAYSFGLSLEQAAALTGAGRKELLNYIGATRMHDEAGVSLGISERLKKLKEVLSL